jgi:hypothetical protein
MRGILPGFPLATDLGDGPGLVLGALTFPLRFKALLGGVGDRIK